MATTTSSTSLPGYVEEPVKKSITGIQDWLDSDANYVYGSKPGEKLWTPLSGSQNKAVGNINWLADQDLAKMFGVDQAQSLWSQFGNDSPEYLDENLYGSQPGGERIIDESGSLGAIGDYINPYLQQVLQPQIREMDEALQRGRRDLGSNAAMSGSFGDARHGILEGEMYRGTNEAISDTTGRAYSDAWNNAMSLRSGDREDANRALERQLGADTTNLGAQMERIANKGRAAEGIQTSGRQFYDLFTDVNDSLFNAGQIEREAEQERNDAMRSFQEALKNKKYDDAIKLLGAVTGAPASSTSTSSKSGSEGIMSIIGAMLGGITGGGGGGVG